MKGGYEEQVLDPRTCGLKRKGGARPLRRTEAGELCTMRDLRLEVIPAPKAA